MNAALGDIRRSLGNWNYNTIKEIVNHANNLSKHGG